MGKSIFWGVVGLVVGSALGGFVAGVIGVGGAAVRIISGAAGILVGICSFVSSKKNHGVQPSWLGGSKKTSGDKDTK